MIEQEYDDKNGVEQTAFLACKECGGTIVRVPCSEDGDYLHQCEDCRQLEGETEYRDCETNEVVEV